MPLGLTNIPCRMAGAIIMEIVFGHEVKSIEDNFLQVASKGGRTIAAAGPVGAHLVDLIPLCTCFGVNPLLNA